MPLPFVREADPQARDRAAAERGHRVEGVAAPERADAPGGVGAEVPRAVRDDDDVRSEDLLGGEHPRPHRDGLELSAEGLSGGDPSVDQPRIAELEHQP